MLNATLAFFDNLFKYMEISRVAEYDIDRARDMFQELD